MDVGLVVVFRLLRLKILVFLVWFFIFFSFKKVISIWKVLVKWRWESGLLLIWLWFCLFEVVSE